MFLWLVFFLVIRGNVVLTYEAPDFQGYIKNKKCTFPLNTVFKDNIINKSFTTMTQETDCVVKHCEDVSDIALLFH